MLSFNTKSNNANYDKIIDITVPETFTLCQIQNS